MLQAFALRQAIIVDGKPVIIESVQHEDGSKTSFNLSCHDADNQYSVYVKFSAAYGVGVGVGGNRVVCTIRRPDYLPVPVRQHRECLMHS